MLSITAGMASCNDLKFGSKNRNQAFNWHKELFLWRSSKLRYLGTVWWFAGNYNRRFGMSSDGAQDIVFLITGSYKNWVQWIPRYASHRNPIRFTVSTRLHGPGRLSGYNRLDCCAANSAFSHYEFNLRYVILNILYF